MTVYTWVVDFAAYQLGPHTYLVVVVPSPSHVWLFATPWTAAHQASLSSPSPEVCPSSRPLHRWCHPAISSSVVLFSFCPQFFPASGSFPMSHTFTSDDQNTGVWAPASVPPMSIQGWFTLRLTGLISLLSRNLFQHHSSKASILWCSAFFTVQLSQPYVTTGKTTALPILTYKHLKWPLCMAD